MSISVTSKFGVHISCENPRKTKTEITGYRCAAHPAYSSSEGFCQYCGKPLDPQEKTKSIIPNWEMLEDLGSEELILSRDDSPWLYIANVEGYHMEIDEDTYATLTDLKTMFSEKDFERKFSKHITYLKKYFKTVEIKTGIWTEIW